MKYVPLPDTPVFHLERSEEKLSFSSGLGNILLLAFLYHENKNKGLNS